MNKHLYKQLNTTKWLLLSRFFIDHTHPQVGVKLGTRMMFGLLKALCINGSAGRQP